VRTGLWVLGLGLWGTIATAARAAPPDARLAIELGAPKIERIDPSFTVVESDDETVVRAELLPSGELLLEPKHRGTTRVFLFAPRLVRVIEISIGEPLPAIDPAPALPCAKPLINVACYPAWRTHLQHLLASDAPPLELEIEALQEELKQATAALGKAGLNLSLAINAFGIKIKSGKEVAEPGLERRALRTIWPFILGPMRLDR
jgi:hypothetical protein